MKSVVQRKDRSNPFITDLILGAEYPNIHVLYQSKVDDDIVREHDNAMNNPNYCLLLRIRHIAFESSSNMSDVKEIVQEAMEEYTH